MKLTAKKILGVLIGLSALALAIYHFSAEPNLFSVEVWKNEKSGQNLGYLVLLIGSISVIYRVLKMKK